MGPKKPLSSTPTSAASSSSSPLPSRKSSTQVLFDATPEIFAIDNQGSFEFPLLYRGKQFLDSTSYDEVRLVVSVWHPAEKQLVDLDRAYVELRAAFDPEEDHWTRVSEVEPVVPPYNAGETFDGWVVLPVLAALTAFRLHGAGFDPRTRLQIRCSAYFVGT